MCSMFGRMGQLNSAMALHEATCTFSKLFSSTSLL